MDERIKMYLAIESKVYELKVFAERIDFPWLPLYNEALVMSKSTKFSFIESIDIVIRTESEKRGI